MSSTSYILYLNVSIFFFYFSLFLEMTSQYIRASCKFLKKEKKNVTLLSHKEFHMSQHL